MTQFFPWSDDYAVHLRVIDNDHKDLVETVNALHDAIGGGAPRGQIGQIIANLAAYVEEHFAREEELMESYGYPDVARHKRIHRHLARTVFAIRIVFASEPKKIDPVKLLQFLRDWLVHHILEEDMKYAPFLRGNGRDEGGSDGAAADDSALANGTGPAAPGLPAALDPEGDGEETTVTLTVPASKAAALRRCARLLADGGTESIAIEDIVMPVGHMTAEEALHFARPILR